ncbi:phage tail protein [Bradyrhizobium guangzhouense]|uniref:Phage tail protein n=1 Tax=Bradyrhizobium guangzhouense TaxID=1325095 RepID=A0AAE5X0G7_9BRAD|nr:tail fiber protein [Bradyrhizobium guangzhouense]QAU46355.1 phage tail protein [Bradyrhizobium guangzhouense]RXH13560.1 phage tail protein [Bradyrhizobium guangzhouense]RXH15357.1 phage tail protein [Bradyrhizobium guangzhouense]
MQNPFVGQITLYPYNFAPKGWATCWGQILPISQYTALFSLIGTYFGGNGTSNFALPDLRGRVPLGMGQLAGGSDYVLGELSGIEGVNLSNGEMPAHTHLLNAINTPGTVADPSNAFLAEPFVGNRSGGSSGNPYNQGPPNTVLAPQTTIGLAGNNLPHNNIQPSLVLTPCIALVGVYPARN